jgi:glycosyltransferase involved in cell wall biosynthesis
MLRGVRDLFEVIDDYRTAGRLYEKLRADRCAFIYERMAPFRQVGYLASKRARIPWLLEINDPMQETLQYYPSPLRRYGIWLGWKMAAKADGIVVGSRRLKEYFVAHGIAADRILVTYPTVDYDSFQRPQDTSSRHSAVRIGFVGSMKVWHGGDLLIRAFKALLRNVGDVELDMIGDGPEIDRWKELAVTLGVQQKVTFHGSVDFQHMPNVIRDWDICAIPNATWYGSPTKLFEYGAIGKTVIGPTDTPIDEIITHGVNGFLFKKGDVDGLADGLHKLVQDRCLRQTLGVELHRKLRREITWRGNIEDIVSLWRRLPNMAR